MDRRNFLSNLLVAGASFAILPGAGRLWRAQRCVPNPMWVDADYEVVFLYPNVDPHKMIPIIHRRQISPILEKLVSSEPWRPQFGDGIMST